MSFPQNDTLLVSGDVLYEAVVFSLWFVNSTRVCVNWNMLKTGFGKETQPFPSEKCTSQACLTVVWLSALV